MIRCRELCVSRGLSKSATACRQLHTRSGDSTAGRAAQLKAIPGRCQSWLAPVPFSSLHRLSCPMPRQRICRCPHLPNLQLTHTLACIAQASVCTATIYGCILAYQWPEAGTARNQHGPVHSRRLHSRALEKKLYVFADASITFCWYKWAHSLAPLNPASLVKPSEGNRLVCRFQRCRSAPYTAQAIP